MRRAGDRGFIPPHPIGPEYLCLRLAELLGLFDPDTPLPMSELFELTPEHLAAMRWAAEVVAPPNTDPG